MMEFWYNWECKEINSEVDLENINLRILNYYIGEILTKL